jgi:hypothetical protein
MRALTSSEIGFVSGGDKWVAIWDGLGKIVTIITLGDFLQRWNDYAAKNGAGARADYNMDALGAPTGGSVIDITISRPMGELQGTYGPPSKTMKVGTVTP